jgi:hypothetical protein
MNYTELQAAICDYTQNFEQDFVANIPVFVQQAEQRIYNTVQFPSIRKNVTGATSTGNQFLSCPNDFLAVYSLGIIDALGNHEFLLNKDENFIRQAYPNINAAGVPKYYALFGPTTTNDSSPVITDELTFKLGPTPNAVYNVILHYYYYPMSITVVSAIAAITVGTPLVPPANGTYVNVPLTSIGSGAGATATIVVQGGVITSFTINNPGEGYTVGQILTATSVGPAVSCVVTQVIGNGTSWLGDNFDSVLLYGSLVEAITFMKGEADMVALYDGKYKEALALAKRLGDGMERQDAYRSGQYRQAVT